MPESLNLVAELAIILIAAGVFTVIFKALKQPLILGYIIAGFLVGPQLGLVPQFGADTIDDWAELGIIFLLFGLGLEFSFKKLLRIGSSALVITSVKCLGMFGVGIILASLLGWSAMEGAFLGCLLGMSSTTIIIKSYSDLNLKNRPFAPVVFGSLIFEDLFAVLFMVILSAMAVTGKFQGVEMLQCILKLVFFIILWFLVGLYILPWLLKKVKKYLDDEIVMLVGIGLCFLMVVLANLSGFSSALGAFVMGSLLAETTEGVRIDKLTSQIKDLFGAIFFVSVGMMVDPAVIAEHWTVILLITLVAVVFILLFSTTGALMSGQGVSNSVHIGFSLAQLGEFSFILAGLGCGLGVVREFIYPVIVAASVITTFTTPLMIKLGDPVAAFLQRKLPVKVLSYLNPKKENVVKISVAEHNEWKKLLKIYSLRIVLYSVMAIAVYFLCTRYLGSWLNAALPKLAGKPSMNWIHLLASIAIMSPFVLSILFSGTAVSKLSAELLRKNPSNRWPITALVCFRAVLATVFLVSVIPSSFLLSRWMMLIISLIGIVVFFIFARLSVSRISPLESTFINNLNTKEEMERRNAPVAFAVREKLNGYNVHIKTVKISSDFEYAGKSLREMPFRHQSGVNIIKIVRGTHSIIIPRGDDRIYPGDELLAVGTDEQLEKFESIIKTCTSVGEDNGINSFSVEAVPVEEESSLANRSIRDLSMRENCCMIVSILSAEGKLETNPSAESIIRPGDTLWIAGETESVQWYRK